MEWANFLDDYQVEYTTRGPNTKRGEISIKCPWCGDEDPSQHLGISLTSENWGCLRNAAHRGRTPTHLIAAIVGCSHEQAKLLVRQYSQPDPASFDDVVKLLGEEPSHLRPDEPPTMRSIKPEGSTAKFWRYLERRGFDDVAALTEQYQLKCALLGRFKDRIIVPFFRAGEMIAWSGRAITNPVNAPRYLSSAKVKDTVLNEDELKQGGKRLFVVEGPFDALKLDYYGQHYAARATCTSGTSFSAEQVYLLNKISQGFEQVTILLDNDAVESSFRMSDWLYKASIETLPYGVKDPGEMTPDQVRELVDRNFLPR